VPSVEPGKYDAPPPVTVSMTPFSLAIYRDPLIAPSVSSHVTCDAVTVMTLAPDDLTVAEKERAPVVFMVTPAATTMKPPWSA
jgi:hypothetical protein